jgi:hypothetical protein
LGGGDLGSARAGGVEGGNARGGLNRDWTDLLDNRGPAGPITGADFLNWSEELRRVEDWVGDPDLRNELAAARERARGFRQDFKRERKKPDWAVVRLQVMNPLVQVQQQIREELARRESREALVPIDRDPVPSRYSELVRRYYEQLGKDE